MMRYLLVASAASSVNVLVERARELAAQASHVSFVLITPLARGVADRDVAEHLASANDLLAFAQLRRAGLRVERSAIGDAAPLMAIQDELRGHPDAYDAVVLASPVPRLAARLLARDDHSRAERLPLPIIHVFEGGGDTIGLSRLPVPLSSRAQQFVAQPRAWVQWVAHVLQRPRLGLALLLLPVVTYLAVGLGLVIFVNRGFLFNEVLAFVLYCALLIALVIIERTEPDAAPHPGEDQHSRTVTRR